MQAIIYSAIFVATFLFMEFMAWFTHKYVMHGFLWIWHRDHHQKEPGFFERNDLFFVVYALPSMLLTFFGSLHGIDWRFFAGIGIMAYGFTYFMVHDVFIHQRFKWFRKANSTYFKGLRKAHNVHHKYREKEGGECFGMLWVPIKYFRESARKSKVKTA